MLGIELLPLLGFCLAAYAIVANDAIQTLGTFIASNQHRKPWVLWLFSSAVLLSVLITGWLLNGGDPAYGRLEKFPEPESGITWIHIVPLLIIIMLTRYGIPVSTTFLVLIVFAPTNLEKMLTKSALGYVVAFISAYFLYRFAMKTVTLKFANTPAPTNDLKWIGLQWCATAFLWSQWLIQDLANIFVYFPRTVDFTLLMVGATILVGLNSIIFFYKGGRIQQVVTSKSQVTDIRAATIIDFFYATVLFIFKELNNVPMSTTWVFLGVLAGRQLAMATFLPGITQLASLKLIRNDLFKAGSGLLISIALALAVASIGT